MCISNSVVVDEKLVSLPVVVDGGETHMDPEASAADMDIGCLLGFHVWDGNRCINCGKIR